MLQKICHTLTKQVSVHQCHQIPQHPEQEPGPRKRGREQEQLVAPLHVQKCCPEVPHVQSIPAADVLDAHVATPIFGQDTPPLPQSPTPTG